MKPCSRPDQHDPALSSSRHAARQRGRQRGGGDEIHQSQSCDLRGVFDQVAWRSGIAHSGDQQRQADRARIILLLDRNDRRRAVGQIKRTNRNLGPLRPAKRRDSIQDADRTG